SVADRFDRRRILITNQLAATGVTATLTVLVAAGTITPALLIVFAATLSVTNAFWTPTMMAFVPSLVEPARLSTALALNSVTFNVGRAVGPLLATLVIDAVGPAWAFGVNTCSYLAVVVGIFAVHPLTRQVQPARRPRFRQSLRLVAADTRLAGLLLAISAMNLATDPVITLGPAFIVHAFHHQDSLAGLLVGAFRLGAVAAAFTVGYRLGGSRMSIAAALATTGVGMVAFSLSTTLAVALVMLFIAGFGYLCSNTTTTTRLQLEVSDEHRGRIMALWAVAFNGVRPIGSLVDGAIPAGIGLRVAGVAMALPAPAAAGIRFPSLP